METAMMKITKKKPNFVIDTVEKNKTKIECDCFGVKEELERVKHRVNRVRERKLVIEV